MWTAVQLRPSARSRPGRAGPGSSHRSPLPGGRRSRVGWCAPARSMWTCWPAPGTASTPGKRPTSTYCPARTRCWSGTRVPGCGRSSTRWRLVTMRSSGRRWRPLCAMRSRRTTTVRSSRSAGCSSSRTAAEVRHRGFQQPRQRLRLTLGLVPVCAALVHVDRIGLVPRDDPVAGYSRLRVLVLLDHAVSQLTVGRHDLDRQQQAIQAGIAGARRPRRLVERPYREVRLPTTTDVDATIRGYLLWPEPVCVEPVHQPADNQGVLRRGRRHDRQDPFPTELVPVVLVGRRHGSHVIKCDMGRHLLTDRRSAHASLRLTNEACRDVGAVRSDEAAPNAYHSVRGRQVELARPDGTDEVLPGLRTEAQHRSIGILRVAYRDEV